MDRALRVCDLHVVRVPFCAVVVVVAFKKQVSFALALSSFRYDRLLDYGFLLDDKTATQIVYRHHCSLMSGVQETLEQRNEARKQAGKLTYPYLLPKWLPNGIQT